MENRQKVFLVNKHTHTKSQCKHGQSIFVNTKQVCCQKNMNKKHCWRNKQKNVYENHVTIINNY